MSSLIEVLWNNRLTLGARVLYAIIDLAQDKRFSLQELACRIGCQPQTVLRYRKELEGAALLRWTVDSDNRAIYELQATVRDAAERRLRKLTRIVSLRELQSIRAKAQAARAARRAARAEKVRAT